jgi:hypothetical protein
LLRWLKFRSAVDDGLRFERRTNSVQNALSIGMARDGITPPVQPLRCRVNSDDDPELASTTAIGKRNGRRSRPPHSADRVAHRPLCVVRIDAGWRHQASRGAAQIVDNPTRQRDPFIIAAIRRCDLAYGKHEVVELT